MDPTKPGTVWMAPLGEEHPLSPRKLYRLMGRTEDKHFVLFNLKTGRYRIESPSALSHWAYMPRDLTSPYAMPPLGMAFTFQSRTYEVEGHAWSLSEAVDVLIMKAADGERLSIPLDQFHGKFKPSEPDKGLSPPVDYDESEEGKETP